MGRGKESVTDQQKNERSGPDIFIRYAHENYETAHHLAEALSAEGRNVWWDQESSGGAAFADVITENDPHAEDR